MKFKDLHKERGEMISTFIVIETAISMIISRHYLGTSDKETDFLVNVLGNDQSSFALKRNILQHILKVDNSNESPLEDLNKLNKIRNTFAHRQHISNEIPQTSESEIYYADSQFPWNKAKNISAEDLKIKFYKLAPSVIDWLYALALKKGMPLPPK